LHGHAAAGAVSDAKSFWSAPRKCLLTFAGMPEESDMKSWSEGGGFFAGSGTDSLNLPTVGGVSRAQGRMIRNAP
jgi:hypothetical protein